MESLLIKNEARMDVYEEIEMERIRQDKIWGGPAHDDLHGIRDWVAYIVNYLGQAVNRDAEWGRDLDRVRECLIKVAALCVAAIESADRKTKN